MKQQLTEDQLYFVATNLHIFGNGYSASMQERQQVYELYNHIEQTQKKPNSCGRCWRKTKETVYRQYLKQTNIY